MQRFAIALVFLALFSTPIVANAASPIENPRCWTAQMCAAVSESRGIVTQFAKDAAECGSPEWGRCLAGETIPIRVHIPGTDGDVTAVANVGSYIAAIYRWAVPLAAVVAVVVIMVGGVLWMVGGAAGQVQRAKTFIMNAVIGLGLVLLSYLILQTVNPDLVQLSLPRTAIIRSVTLAEDICTELPEGTRFSAKGADSATSGVDNIAIKTKQCGLKFSTVKPDGTSSTCVASFCDGKQVCVPFSPGEYHCQTGAIGGRITTLSEPVRSIAIVAACKNGGSTSIESAALSPAAPKQQNYRFVSNSAFQVSARGASGESANRTAAVACGGDVANIAGYVLAIDGTLYGKNSCSGQATPIPTTLADLGKQVVFYPKLFSVGETTAAFAGVGSIECNINLQQ
ncbi:MAG: hypothetical protein Q7S96_00150 [bacterium]|nr:hypothetical protein [bacterium]